MDTYTTLVMKGLGRLTKSSEDRVFVNKGYYCHKLKNVGGRLVFEDLNKFINIFTDQELFDYVGTWESGGPGIITPNDNRVCPLIAKLDNENGTYKQFETKYLTRNDTKISYKRRVEYNGANGETNLPQTIPKVNFVNTYFVYIDNERSDYLVLKPAIKDYDPKSSVYFLFGKVPANELLLNWVPVDMGFHSLATKSNFTGVKFLGVFLGPDLHTLAEAGIPARLVLEKAPTALPGLFLGGLAHLELYLPLHGMKFPEIPFPSPNNLSININSIEKANYLTNCTTLYKVGMTTIEGYKLISQTEKVLYFDNGFRLYDLNSGLLERNIIDFGTEITFINNDMYRVADARKREIMSSLIGTAITTGLGMVPGLLTGRSLVKAGTATKVFSENSSKETSANLVKMNTEKSSMGNLQLKLLETEFKKKKNPTEIDKEILSLEKGIQKSRNALIGQKQLFDTSNIAHSRERGYQIGESQKIAGKSQIMYSAISPASAITGGVSDIVSFINERTIAPANINQGANTATQSAMTFWSEDWYKYTVSEHHQNYPAQGLWSQWYMKYYPNQEYIITTNLHLLDNGINIALFLKLKDLLKDNPNCVLNIDPDSIMKLFYKYFEYLPNEFETEVLEFFNGTFVYWTTQYPEHRGQTFKLIG